MSMQQFCLRWNNHQPNFVSVFSNLLNSESLVDVTLAAEGRHLQAHKVVLSACSSYFQSLFTVNPCQHPIVILKDVKFMDLKVMVDFMYYGEVNVSQEQLPHILKTAEMLKIKGLAEMPALQKSQSGSSERGDMLTPGDSNWSSDVQRRSLSPMSPGSRRKRLRKSSTGSGSGSTERTSEEQAQDPRLGSPSAVSGITSGSVIKPDPGFASDCSTTPLRTIKQTSSSDSEPHRESSQESVDGDVILQIPSTQSQHHHHHHPHSQPTSDSMEPSLVELTCPPSTSSGQPSTTTDKLGTKRGRLLMRQPRVKKESDMSQHSPEAELQPAAATTSSPPPPQQQQHMQQFLLSVPHARIERQCSEPALMPSVSPPPALQQVAGAPPPLSLLAVPGCSTGLLVKQHSHPLLPSQVQHAQQPPPPRTSTPLPVHFLVPAASGGGAAAADPDRAPSPVVIVTDPLAADAVVARPEPATATLRVRTEELKRSVSSPSQAGSPRSSHCPVVRQGPALGCNFCWNTVDAHGRILRRKTKYHCPECQTNLCIVPCFQEYHERHASSAHASSDPVTLTSSVMRVFPKTSSM